MRLYPVPTVPDMPDFALRPVSVRPAPSSVNPHTLRKKLRRSDGADGDAYHEQDPDAPLPATGAALTVYSSPVADGLAFGAPATVVVNPLYTQRASAVTTSAASDGSASDSDRFDPFAYRQAAVAFGSGDAGATVSLVDLLNAPSATENGAQFDPFAQGDHPFRNDTSGVEPPRDAEAPAFDPFGSSNFGSQFALAPSTENDAPTATAFAVNFSSDFEIAADALQPLPAVAQPAAAAPAPVPAATAVPGRPAFVASSIRIASTQSKPKAACAVQVTASDVMLFLYFTIPSIVSLYFTIKCSLFLDIAYGRRLSSTYYI